MSLSSFVTTIFAQATNAASAAATGTLTGDAAAQPQQPPWMTPLMIGVFVAMVYFALIRPQSQAKKKAEETTRGAKTGDKIVTTSGIHGVITNVKDSTVILKIADNVKIEIDKSAIATVVPNEKPADKASSSAITA